MIGKLEQIFRYAELALKVGADCNTAKTKTLKKKGLACRKMGYF